MSRWSLQFDPPDLAGWLWLAVGALAALELVLYLVRGRAPRQAGWRLVAGVGLVLLVLSARAYGLLHRIESYPPTSTMMLGALMIPALVRAYRHTTRALAGRVRVLLLGLRLLALGVIVMLLTRPVVEYVTVTRERGTLAILLDHSRSMGVRDVTADGRPAAASSAISRADALSAALTASRDALAGLAEEADVRCFSFDEQPKELPGPAVGVQGEHTALAGAISRVRDTMSAIGGRPAGIIVVSDGRDNFSSDEEQRSIGPSLAAVGLPLYTVGIGSELPAGQNRSLLARRIDCPESVAVLNHLPVQAEYVAAGLVGVPITFELLWDDLIVDTRELRPSQPQELLRLTFQHTPNAGGLHRVTVRASAPHIAGAPGDLELAQFVRVTDEKIQVLYIDRPRYERAVIARSLEAAAELRVTKVDLPGALHPGVLPSTPGQWQAYHVILIGDVDRTAFPDAVLAGIRDLIHLQGRGLGMLGGLRTLGAGRYADSPLAAVIPVHLGASGQLEAPVAFQLTVQGQQHPVCRLAADAPGTAKLWSRLPAFDGAARLTGIIPTAEVLLRTPAGEPLIAVTEAGRGRSAVVAFDSTWRWSFADEKGLEAQRRFWRQLAIWLANRKPEVWVSSDKPRYDLARLKSQVDRVTLRAGVSDPTTGRMTEAATLTGTITGPDGKSTPLQWLKTGETLESRPDLREPGEYHVKVAAQSGNKSLGASETAFVISAPDPELADATADLENLKRLAQSTRAAGGEYVTLQDFSRLIERLSAQRPSAEITRVERDNVVDRRPWVWLGVFVGLVTLEWIIRRRVGLV